MKATFTSKDWKKFLMLKPRPKSTMVVASKGDTPDIGWIARFLGWENGNAGK